MFVPPKFDVSDFKKYFPKEEYDSLMEEYKKFKFGTSRKERTSILQEKMFEEKLRDKVDMEITAKVRKLYDKVGLTPGHEKRPSDLFQNITPEELKRVTLQNIREL